ncbi:uncharacterized protein ACLA_084140 [Aspergillus clavatus NRRL 1]|uniref:Conserved leucine-rich repeat protein n=1 Tax=Aspergillus clavatus (strain ATCC 1007 / CBS 513.65 / DSM 816 / NCTC 3887 / NRRL 1 / QM 1276 / 107) TaxID=344612 RepID=A1CTT2_ASPCL|nr:conserved leucine-rich repeat protein [Aspergillus clavatus NRRL 1]EAW06719.1 conserved leucine-rich repeat protein [Aspergillus clavatus NRRL 1]
MGDQPWLDDLSDDWVLTPDKPTPISPAPAAASATSSPAESHSSVYKNSPSRIPIITRRLAKQESPADEKKKVTRPCHFYRREPPTPKTPRTPKTPSKLRSPVPDKTSRSPRPSLPSARKPKSTMGTRSPLRSVSNVSSPSSQHDTVQVRPKKGKEKETTTPEWQKRLIQGELPSGEQRDLFAPIGLESVFKPPTPGSDTTQKGAFAKMKPADDLWDFSNRSSARKHTRKPSRLSIEVTERESDDSPLQKPKPPAPEVVRRNPKQPIESPTPSPKGTVQKKKVPDTGPPGDSNDGPHNSQIDNRMRTVSGLEDLRNEGITPIMFTRVNTLEGEATAEVIKSALKQVTNKLERLSVGARERPDSRASDSVLLHQQSEIPEMLPEDDLFDATSHSLPQDLSTGTLDYRGRGPFGNVRGEQYLSEASFPRRQLSPSSFPSQRFSPFLPSNSRIRSSPPFYNKMPHVVDPPTLPRPSSAHVGAPPTGRSSGSNAMGIPSSGSPLKLFGTHDTFTNNRLLRRMSQFEETFGDLSEEDEPVSPSETARRKGESRSFLSVRQDTPGDRSTKRHDRPRSRNMMKPRINRFGDGELDNFDFSDTSPYEPKFLNNDLADSSLRPSPRQTVSAKRQPHRNSALKNYSRDSDLHGDNPTKASNNRSEPTADHNDVDDTEEFEKHGTTDTPAKDPNPKRRRTILSLGSSGGDKYDLRDGMHEPADNMSLLQRSLMQHGMDYGDEESLLRPQSSSRPRTPTPSQIRSSLRKRSSSNREGIFDDSNGRMGQKSPTGASVPMLKVTGVDEQVRKGSITTQDFLNEATKIMDIIRAKGKPAVALSSVEESDMEAQNEQESYEDESTREEFSRPPSREGVDIRKLREPTKPNPRVLSHLKKYQEQDDADFDVNTSVMSLQLEKGETTVALPEKHAHRQQQISQRAREAHLGQSAHPDDLLDNDARPPLTIDTQMSSKSFSSRSIPTTSSFSSHAKGMLSSDQVSHLIPEQVNGFTYDRSKHQWVKEKPRRSPEKPKNDDSEEDPFKDIPDLSVDELQEMIKARNLSSPEKTRGQSADEGQGHITSSSSIKTSPFKPGSEAQGTDGPSASGSTVRSKMTRFTSSIPNSETRATSWDGDEPNDTEPSSEVEHEIQLHEGRLSKPPRNQRDVNHQARVVTISFSSPLVSHIVYGDDEHSAKSSQVNADGFEKGVGVTSSTTRLLPTRSSQLIPHRNSLEGRSFLRHSISRIDERGEEVDGSGSLLPRDPGTLDSVPVTEETENSLVHLSRTGHDTTYSFHLSPLPDFTLNQFDQSLHLEVSYIAQRTQSTSLRQVHGTFALATEDLVKHLTEAEPFEPYWDHVRRLILRDKGLTTLHKLNDFCPRLEDLDVSDNEIGQLSGVPTTLRTLRIPRNRLSSLTAWGHLINLQYLDVSNNELESLDGFGSLIHLRELKADGNHIRNLDGVLDLNGLLSLKLSHNSLTAVDFGAAELTRLQELDLSHNQLVSVRHLDLLPSLSKLDLSDNYVKKINLSAPLPSLESLKLANNQLQNLDVSMLQSLVLLYLDQNYLSTISGLERCRGLEILSVREQNLGDQKDRCFDLDLGKIKDIRKVYLSSNKLSTRALQPSSPLLSLQLLDAASCCLHTLPGGFSSNFPNIKVLNLNFNSLSDITELVGLNCLSRLGVAGNSIARLRKLCQVLSLMGRTKKGQECSLHKVDLRGNPLTVRFYPPAVTGNGRLEDKRKQGAISEGDEHQSKAPLDLRSALACMGPHEGVLRSPLWEAHEEAYPERELEINDPYTLPPADPSADRKYLSHLDEGTRLRRKVFELMLYAGTGGSVKFLDGLEFRPVLVEGSDMDHAWSKLEKLGVLKKKKAITQ